MLRNKLTHDPQNIMIKLTCIYKYVYTNVSICTNTEDINTTLLHLEKNLYFDNI